MHRHEAWQIITIVTRLIAAVDYFGLNLINSLLLCSDMVSGYLVAIL